MNDRRNSMPGASFPAYDQGGRPTGVYLPRRCGWPLPGLRPSEKQICELFFFDEFIKLVVDLIEQKFQFFPFPFCLMKRCLKKLILFVRFGS